MKNEIVEVGLNPDFTSNQCFELEKTTVYQSNFKHKWPIKTVSLCNKNAIHYKLHITNMSILSKYLLWHWFWFIGCAFLESFFFCWWWENSSDFEIVKNVKLKNHMFSQRKEPKDRNAKWMIDFNLKNLSNRLQIALKTLGQPVCLSMRRNRKD